MSNPTARWFFGVRADDVTWDEMLAHIEAQHGFKVANAQMEFVGYCADCQARENEE